MGSELANLQGGLHPRRLVVVLGVLLLILLGCLALAALVGPTAIDLEDLLSGDDTDFALFKLWSIRLPKALAALVVGGCLAVAGVIFQALIHNPLASPYILGVSAGGSLGAVIALALGTTVVVPFAFLGATLSIALVYGVARSHGRVLAETLLLSGVIVNSFFSACIMFITITTGSDQTLRIMRWLVGGLMDLYEGTTLLWSGAALVILAGFAWLHGRALNLIAVGDATAERLGVPVQTARVRLFLLASLLTAVAVSISGPIGFVGLIIPHILRLLIGPDHRVLLPASALAGGAFLVLADTLASVVWYVPLPVGLLTAFLGAPFFVWLLKTRDLRRIGHG